MSGSERPEWVYAHVGKDGRILYIGRTRDLRMRANGHRQVSEWWADVVEVRILHARVSHVQARRLERAQIEAHDPPNNYLYTAAWHAEHPEHGYGAYSNGCRCDTCRAAKAEYVRSRRRKAAERAKRVTTRLSPGGGAWPVGTERHFVSGVKHGSSYAYFERGCRCPDCTAWRSADEAARRQRRQGVAA